MIFPSNCRILINNIVSGSSICSSRAILHSAPNSGSMMPIFKKRKKEINTWVRLMLRIPRKWEEGRKVNQGIYSIPRVFPFSYQVPCKWLLVRTTSSYQWLLQIPRCPGFPHHLSWFDFVPLTHFNWAIIINLHFWYSKLECFICFLAYFSVYISIYSIYFIFQSFGWF